MTTATLPRSLALTSAPKDIEEDIELDLPHPSQLKHVLKNAVHAPKARGVDDDDDDDEIGGGLPAPAAMKAEVKAMKAKAAGSTNPKETTPPVPPPVLTVVTRPPKAVEAANPSAAAVMKNYKDLILGYVYAKSLQKVYKEDPELYVSSKTEDMVAVTKKLAKNMFNFFQKGLGAILPATKLAERTMHKKTLLVKLHDEILTDLFKGFKLSEGDLSQLDGMLNSFMKSLKEGIDVSVDINHVTDSNSLCVVQFTPIILSVKDSDGVKIPAASVPVDQQVFEMQVRVFFFELSQDTYKLAVGVGKDSVNVQTVDLNMTWLDFNGVVNTAVMEDYKDFLKLKQEEITSQVTKYLDNTKSNNQRTVRTGQLMDKDDYDSCTK